MAKYEFFQRRREYHELREGHTSSISAMSWKSEEQSMTVFLGFSDLPWIVLCKVHNKCGCGRIFGKTGSLGCALGAGWPMMCHLQVVLCDRARYPQHLPAVT